MAPQLPQSYPRTVTGLLAALEPLTPAEIASTAEAFDQFARRLSPPYVRTGRTHTPSARPGQPAGRSAPIVTAPDVTAGAVTAAGLARRLAAAVRSIPRVVVALRSIESGTAPSSTMPLVVPDDVDDQVIRDAGTGAPVTDPDAVLDVTWWPMLQPAAIAVGLDLHTATDDDQLRIVGCTCEFYQGHVWRSVRSPAEELAGYAGALAKVRGRLAGWQHFSSNIRGSGGSSSNRARIRAQLRPVIAAYVGWLAVLDPIGDRLAANVGAYLETLWSALAALAAIEGEPMPTIATPSAVASLAARIRDSITAGQSGRLAVSDSEIAFAWAPNQPTTLLSFLATNTVSGRHTTVVTASNSATPVGPVAEKGAKPTAVTFTSTEVDLQKYAGLAVLSTEAANFTANIEAAVANVLVTQTLRAIEADAATAMDTGAGVDIAAAADITAGVLAAIAAIRGNGGAPNVVGLNSADWIEVMSATGSSGYLNFSNPEAGPAGTWLGLSPVLVPGLAAGSAIVADGSAVSVLEPAGGPLCIVDLYSKLSTNEIQIASEAWAVTQVTSPGGVATVTVTP